MSYASSSAFKLSTLPWMRPFLAAPLPFNTANTSFATVSSVAWGPTTEMEPLFSPIEANTTRP